MNNKCIVVVIITFSGRMPRTDSGGIVLCRKDAENRKKDYASFIICEQTREKVR